MSPTLAPSVIPLTDKPTKRPTTKGPTGHPTISPRPTTATPTEEPSVIPTFYPTKELQPVARPHIVPHDMTSETLTTFCVIADVPYDQKEVDELPNQIATQMDGCEFLIHLGDLFIGDTACDEEDYFVIRDIMLESKVPTFVVVGDNEWNDCQRSMVDIGWERWTENFLRFENMWAHNFTVVRQPGYEENFYFLHKRTLFIGLTIVGGVVRNKAAWDDRLRIQYEWTREVINWNLPTGNADGVIFMAHAKPSADHQHFFVPFRDYVKNELKNEYPVLYLHGDGHDFMYTPYFRNQSNFLRIQHEGGVSEPVLKILADPHKQTDSVYNAFQYDRQFHLLQ